MSEAPSLPSWVEPLCRIARDWRAPGATIGGLFAAAAPDLSDRTAFTTAVGALLRSSPELVDAWQWYSWDKRTSPSPYLDGTEVGFVEGAQHADVRRYEDAAAACAEFIYREAAWVLERRRVAPTEGTS